MAVAIVTHAEALIELNVNRIEAALLKAEELQHAAEGHLPARIVFLKAIYQLTHCDRLIRLGLVV